MNVIVIDHMPEAESDQRHIYSLYAHLESRSVYKGQLVEKGETVGRSGNTGMRYYYMGKKRGYHLHFEMIDAPKELKWSAGGFHGTSYRVNPMGRNYIGGALKIE